MAALNIANELLTANKQRDAVEIGEDQLPSPHPTKIGSPLWLKRSNSVSASQNRFTPCPMPSARDRSLEALGTRASSPSTKRRERRDENVTAQP